MNSKIRIGLWFPETDDVETHFKSVTKEVAFQSEGFTESFIPLQSDHFFSSLENDETDVVTTNLGDAPYHLPETCRYIALCPVESKNTFIHMQTDHYAPGEDLKMIPSTIVGVPNKMAALQLQYLKPEVITKWIDEPTLANPTSWKNAGIHAALSEDFNVLPETDLTDYTQINLHPSEFLRKPGEGYLVFAAHRESVSISQQIIRKYHQKGSSTITNIQRETAKYFANRSHLKVRTYCRKDERNYFYFTAAVADLEQNKYFRHTMSQSTHHRLAEKMIRVLESLLISS